MLVGIYITFIAIAFLSSLYSFRLDIFHYKVISLVMTVDLIVEIWANILQAYHLNNLPIYNFAMLAEFWLYAYYFSLITRYRYLRRIIRIYLVLLPIVWIILVIFVLGIGKWNSHFLVLGSIFTIFFATVYYYQLFTDDQLVRLSTSFEFWIATGLIIFYACSLPYLGMLQLLTALFKPLAHQMLTILQIFNIIFYAIFTYAFICVIRTRNLS